MHAMKPRLISILVVLVMASIACQLFAPKTTLEVSTAPPASPTTAPEVQETAAVAPTATTAQATEAALPTAPALVLPPLPSAQPGPDPLDLATLPLDLPTTDYSEHLTNDMQWTDPDDTAQSSSSAYIYQTQTVPTVAWNKIYQDDNPFLASTFQTTVIDQQAYSASSDTGCQLVAVDKLPGDSPRDPFQSLLQGLTGQVSLSETNVQVGDLSTDIYLLDASNVTPGTEMVIKNSAASDSGEFSSTTTTTIRLMQPGDNLDSGKLYLAQQGGFAARIELSFSRTATEEDGPFFKPGTPMLRTLVYEAIPATPRDTPIQPPEGCTDQSGNENANTNENFNANENENENENTNDTGFISISDVPRLDDASNVIQAEGSLIYQSNHSVQEALDFYKGNLTSQGWKAGDEISLGSLATVELTRGGQTLTVTITQSGSNILVTIDLS